jgi:hypothetical protein
MINPNKTYQTRTGLPVRVFATDLGGDSGVAAAIQLTASSEQLVRLNKYGQYEVNDESH